MIHIRYNIVFEDIGEAMEALESKDWDDILKESEEEGLIIDKDMKFDVDSEGKDVFIVDICVHDKDE